MTTWSARWTTTTGATGDSQTSYTQANDSVILKILAGCANYEGVAPGYLNKLAITTTGANVVQIDTGAAVIDGKVFLNDAASTLGVASAVGGGNTRIDRVVARVDWAGTDIDLSLLGGTDGAVPTVPDLAATSGTTYDLPLAQVLVGVAGITAITDERTWAYPYSANGISVLGVAGNAADTVAPIYPAGDGLALRRSGSTLGFGEISGLAIADDAVASEHIGTMVPVLSGRQGGSSGDWSAVGTTNYTSGLNVRIQAGVRQVTVANGATTGTATITFPVAFSAEPIMSVTIDTASGLDGQPVIACTPANASTATIDIITSTAQAGGDTTFNISWLAIGPE